MPVVTTDSGATKEFIQNDLTGYLIAANDSESLAEKIIYLLKNKKQAIQMGKESKKLIQQKFSLERMVIEFENIYENLIACK